MRCVQVPDPVDLRAELELEGKFGDPDARKPWSYLITRLRLHSAARRMWELIQPVDEQALQELAKGQLYALEMLVGRHRADWSDPLSVRNWVAKYTKYLGPQVDAIYGRPSYYPDPSEVIEHGGGVCRGLAILTASILFSWGVPGVRLTEGHVGQEQSDAITNPLWVTWFPPDGGAPRVLETTGDDQVDHLPTYEDLAEANYIPRAMAERLRHGGALYLCGDYADGWDQYRTQG